MDAQWLGPAFLVLFVVIVAWAIRSARKRQQALGQVARLLGMRFEKRSESLGQDGVAELPMFSKGELRADNVLSGDVGGAICYLFDYTYVARKRRGKRSTYAQGTYACLKVDGRRLPVFRIAHASRGSKRDPIVFESHPALNSDYLVTGEDESAVREVVGTAVLDFLQQHGDDAWAIEANGAWVGVAKRPAVSLKRHVAPEEMRQFRDDVLQIYQALALP